MLLALDTATRTAGIALYDGQLVAELNWHSRDAQTTELLPRVETLLAWSGLRPDDLRALAVSLGPGSFTGLRIALSLAKGMALAFGLPVVGVPTLDVTAYPHLPAAQPVCALVQAGRGRAYWSVYRTQAAAGDQPVTLGDWRGYQSPVALNDSDGLLAALTTPVQLVGEITPELRAGWAAPLPGPSIAARRAGDLAELGWQRWQAGEVDDLAALSPLYLQEP